MALGCLCGLLPVDLAAQNVDNRQIQSMVQGASPQEIMDRLRQSGLSRSEVRDQLLRGGYDPSMADPYFDMMEGVGEAPTEGTAELTTALSTLGILLRDVEAPFEAGFGLGFIRCGFTGVLNRATGFYRSGKPARVRQNLLRENIIISVSAT